MATLSVTPLDDRLLPATGVLLFGNSYTDNSRPDTRVADLVRELAAAAGRPPVVTGVRAPGGETLAGHAAAVDQAAVRAMLPAGQAADLAVFQGQSLEAAAGTVGTETVARFRQGAYDLAADVRGAFPAARVVLYETPARPASAADFYPGFYPAPVAMQADIRDGYLGALGGLRERFGPAVEIAPAGEAFGELGFAADLYLDTGGHPSARGALAVALTVYATAFDDNVSDIPAAAAGPLLASRGLTAADWVAVTPAVDRAVGRAAAAQNERFVRQLYLDVLGRPADAGGLGLFLGRLTDGSLDRRQVAQVIVASDEYARRAVGTQYRQYLGRPADADGLRHFTGQLLAGQGLDRVRVGLVGSDEYFARAGGTPAAFVRQLYRDALGRQADPDGLDHWTGHLAAGASRSDVTDAVLGSTEGRQRQVRADYAGLLRRPADAGGLNAFVGLLRQGVRYQDYLVLLLESSEYYNQWA